MLMVTTPTDPDDLMVKTRQEEVLRAMERYRPKGLVLDISGVETLDFFCPNGGRNQPDGGLDGRKNGDCRHAPECRHHRDAVGLDTGRYPDRAHR